MERLVIWIGKVPLGLWLFLALTQLVNIFASYSHWQATLAILADWREHPRVLRDGIEHMEVLARANYREIWISVALLMVFLACAAIKRGKNHPATQS